MENKKAKILPFYQIIKVWKDGKGRERKTIKIYYPKTVEFKVDD